MGDNGRSTLSRRCFFAAVGGATAAGFVFGRGALEAFAGQAADAVAKIPTRKMGRTGLSVGVVSGNESMRDPAILDAAMEAGVNYWHKAQSFTAALMPAVINAGRENHYIEICHDPAGTAEKCVENFKRSLKDGLEYADFYKIHGTYETRAVEAFHKLKDEGLVKYLSASFHSYKLARQSMKEGHLDAIQISGPPTSHGKLDNVLSVAKETDCGVILMKTMGGLQDKAVAEAVKPYTDQGLSIAQAVTAKCLALEAVTCVVVRTAEFDRLTELLDGVRRTVKVEPAATAAAAEFCAVCGSCEGVCPQGIAVCDVMRCDLYNRGHGDHERAREVFASLGGAALTDSCTSCGACAGACPVGVASPARIAATAKMLA